jgi:hypothetical protein
MEEGKGGSRSGRRGGRREEQGDLVGLKGLCSILLVIVFSPAKPQLDDGQHQRVQHKRLQGIREVLREPRAL